MRVIVFGDTHLGDKNYGKHKNYENDSYDTFSRITQVCEEEKADVIILTGDLSNSVFNKLGYRTKIEELFERMNVLTNHRIYCVKGNHDKAGYGMTEYEYYVNKGVIRPSDNITVDKLNITMIDYGKIEEAVVNKSIENDSLEVVICHDTVAFEDTNVPPYMTYYNLSEYSKFCNTSLFLVGHIHEFSTIKGKVYDESKSTASDSMIVYVGCPTRPQLTDDTDNTGHYVLIDSNSLEMKLGEFELLNKEDIFVMEDKESTEIIGEEARKKIDIGHVVKELDEYNIGCGDVNVLIESLQEDEKYKKKAIDLLSKV